MNVLGDEAKTASSATLLFLHSSRNTDDVQNTLLLFWPRGQLGCLIYKRRNTENNTNTFEHFNLNSAPNKNRWNSLTCILVMYVIQLNTGGGHMITFFHSESARSPLGGKRSTRVVRFQDHVIPVRKSPSAAFERRRPWKPGILAGFGALFLLWISLCFSRWYSKSTSSDTVYSFNQNSEFINVFIWMYGEPVGHFVCRKRRDVRAHPKSHFQEGTVCGVIPDF